MNVKFYIKKNSKSPTANEPLYCFIRHHYEEKAIFTGQRIPPKYWDSKKQTCKKGYEDESLFNDFLASYKASVKRIILQVQTDNPEATFKQIVEAVEAKMNLSKNYQQDFMSVCKQFIEHLKVNASSGYVTKMNSLHDILLDFNAKTGLVRFDKLIGKNMVVWFDKFKEHLAVVSNHQINTIRKDLQFIKTFLRWAYDRGFFDQLDHRQLEKIKIPGEVKKDFTVLSLIEIEKLTNCQLPERLAKVRDIFLFQLYTGQRYSDIFAFSEVQVDKKNMVWSLRQHKGATKRSKIQVPLIEPAQLILKRYNFVLPVISLTRYNVYLKEVAEQAKLDDLCVTEKFFLNGSVVTEDIPKHKLITSHTARRTFATLSIYSGVDKTVIKSYTGHSTDKMLDKYFQNDPVKNKALIENVFQFENQLN